MTMFVSNEKAIEAFLEARSKKYHYTLSWIAVFLNPFFLVLDAYNVPNHLNEIVLYRIIICTFMIINIILCKKFEASSFVIIIVPYLGVCFLDAFVFSIVDKAHLHNVTLGVLTTLIAAGMFLSWPWKKSLLFVLVLFGFIYGNLSENESITLTDFLVNGGIVLFVTAIMMIIFINFRYNYIIETETLNQKLKTKNEELVSQAEEIKSMNDNLEQLVIERTVEIMEKNSKIEEYAFVNSHKLRAPVANILGLVYILEHEKNDNALKHLNVATKELDKIINEITKNLNSGKPILKKVALV
jgi:signal transduction histidine kinase